MIFFVLFFNLFIIYFKIYNFYFNNYLRLIFTGERIQRQKHLNICYNIVIT